MVSAGGQCEADVTARTRCGWVKLRKCGELLYGRRFPLKLKGAVYRSYVRPAILHGNETWELKKDSEIHGESNELNTAPRQKNIYRFDVGFV